MMELWQDPFRHILKYEICFLLIYIQTYRKEFMIADACRSGLLCLIRPPREVFTRITPSFILAMVSALIRCLVSSGKRAVKTDQVTSVPEVRPEIHTPRQSRSWIWEKIISDHLHAEAPADSCHSLTDFSGSDDAGGFADRSLHPSDRLRQNCSRGI